MLKHNGTITLETERLCLRRFCEADAEPMFRNWASHDEVTRYVTWFSHKNIDETKTVVDLWIKEYDEPNRYQWAIVLKDINEPIGSIGVVRQKEDVMAAEIGYCIGDEFWRKGYTSEALSRVLKYLFEEIGFNRISSYHDVRNPNSGLVMQKCGMKYEGTFRDVILSKEGEFVTTSNYSILKFEWK